MRDDRINVRGLKIREEEIGEKRLRRVERVERRERREFLWWWWWFGPRRVAREKQRKVWLSYVEKRARIVGCRGRAYKGERTTDKRLLEYGEQRTATGSHDSRRE